MSASDSGAKNNFWSLISGEDGRFEKIITNGGNVFSFLIPE